MFIVFPLGVLFEPLQSLSVLLNSLPFHAFLVKARYLYSVLGHILLGFLDKIDNNKSFR